MKNKFLFILTAGFFLAACVLLFLGHNSPKRGKVAINKANFNVELASSERERSLGLGNRKSICLNCGMLFVFPEAGKHGFWMKNMNFNLDIIWIKGDEIVYIERNFSKDSAETVNPDIRADKVLEINAGISDANGLFVGNKVFFK
jgi:uncharacterized protein